MHARTLVATTAHVALAASLVAAWSVITSAQREHARPDLSGRWTLNRELSESAEAKLDRLHSTQSSGHGPGRHGGAGGRGEMEDLRRVLLTPAAWLTLTVDGDRIVITDSDGQVRRLSASGQKERVGGRDVRTKWDGDRLVLEAAWGMATVIDTYERAADGARMTVTTTVDVSGQIVTVRRVYDLASSR